MRKLRWRCQAVADEDICIAEIIQRLLDGPLRGKQAWRAVDQALQAVASQIRPAAGRQQPAGAQFHGRLPR